MLLVGLRLAGSGTRGPPAPTSAARCRGGWRAARGCRAVSCASARRCVVGQRRAARRMRASCRDSRIEHHAQVAHDRQQQPAQAFAVAVAVLFGMQRPHLRRGALAFEQRGDLRDIPCRAARAASPRTAGSARRIAAAVTSPSAPRRASEPSVSASTAGGSGASAKGSPSTCSIASRRACGMASAGGCASSAGNVRGVSLLKGLEFLGDSPTVAARSARRTRQRRSCAAQACASRAASRLGETPARAPSSCANSDTRNSSRSQRSACHSGDRRRRSAAAVGQRIGERLEFQHPRLVAGRDRAGRVRRAATSALR